MDCFEETVPNCHVISMSRCIVIILVHRLLNNNKIIQQQCKRLYDKTHEDYHKNPNFHNSSYPKNINNFSTFLNTCRNITIVLLKR